MMHQGPTVSMFTPAILCQNSSVFLQRQSVLYTISHLCKQPGQLCLLSIGAKSLPWLGRVSDYFSPQSPLSMFCQLCQCSDAYQNTQLWAQAEVLHRYLHSQVITVTSQSISSQHCQVVLLGLRKRCSQKQVPTGLFCLSGCYQPLASSNQQANQSRAHIVLAVEA